MTDKNIEYHYDVIQGTDEWLELRMGKLTASEMKKIITPVKLGISSDDESKKHCDDILGQRIDKSFRDSYINDDIERGHIDEKHARKLYGDEKGVKVDKCGFITNSGPWGILGYSPDGLVGDDGLIEIKSKTITLQTKLIMDHVVGRSKDLIPNEYMMQCQAGLFISGRKWIDFISYCNGHPMVTIRVYPNYQMQDAIEAASCWFESTLNKSMKKYNSAIEKDPRLTMTEFQEQEEVEGMYL